MAFHINFLTPAEWAVSETEAAVTALLGRTDTDCTGELREDLASAVSLAEATRADRVRLSGVLGFREPSAA